MTEETQPLTPEEVAKDESLVDEVELAGHAEESEPDPVAGVVADQLSEKATKSIKETKEVLAALNVLSEFIAKMFADGHVNSADFVHVLALLKDLDTFSDAFGNISEVDDELKDLDDAEVIELGLAAYSLVKKTVAAVKKKSK